MVIINKSFGATSGQSLEKIDSLPPKETGAAIRFIYRNINSTDPELKLQAEEMAGQLAAERLRSGQYKATPIYLPGSRPDQFIRENPIDFGSEMSP